MQVGDGGRAEGGGVARCGRRWVLVFVMRLEKRGKKKIHFHFHFHFHLATFFVEKIYAVNENCVANELSQAKKFI